MTAAPHLYVHVPFCAHRCGYCDFVTITGRTALHERYVAALETELRAFAEPVETVFIGGGTPTLLADPLLARLLAALPPAAEVTIECNPETVTKSLTRVLVEGGVTRVSLGAQSFSEPLLEVLERRALPATVLAAVECLRAGGVTNLNLDLMFGVPGQTDADLAGDLDAAIALRPDHISYYELEAKPGTRFTHAHGAELERVAERIEHFYGVVVERLRAAGYRWYETANFCRPGRESQHNLGYWLAHDYVGLGVGAVSTVGLRRTRNRPGLMRYLEAVEAGEAAPAEHEELSADQREFERLMLGLRLDRPLEVASVAGILSAAGVERMRAGGMLSSADGRMWLTDRGRQIADEVVLALVR